MNKIWVVACREYLATVRTKAFVISIVMLPILMTLSIVVQVVTSRLEDESEKRFAIIDRTPGTKVFPILEVAVKRRNDTDTVDAKTGKRRSPRFALEKVEPSTATPEAIGQQRLELSERVRKGKLAGFLEIGPKAMNEASSFDFIRSVFGKGAPKKEKQKSPDPKNDPAATRYQSKPTIAGSMDFYRWAAIEISLATRLGLASQKPEVREALMEQRVPVVMLGLSEWDADSQKVVDDEGAAKSLAGIFVGLGCVMLMFMIIMAVATPLMQGVLEEKMQRIAEVLLGSLTPFELMAGKLLGGVGVALTLSIIYLGGAYWAVYQYKVADQVPLTLIAWFLFYMVLSLLMYGSMFMAVGAACTDMKEPQSLMLPVLLPAMLPMFLLGPVLRDPDGVVARGASFFPPSTPMLMLARQALSANIQWWEPVLGSLLVLGFTVLCVWAAGRIFRVGILVQGKGAKLGEMVSWVFRG